MFIEKYYRKFQVIPLVKLYLYNKLKSITDSVVSVQRT